MKLLSVTITAVVLFSLTAVAQDRFIGKGPWRSIAPDHYYSGKCCFCLRAEEMRPGVKDGTTQYRVGNQWYVIPDTHRRPPDPKNPTYGIVICDPIQQKYMCAIIDARV